MNQNHYIQDFYNHIAQVQLFKPITAGIALTTGTIDKSWEATYNGLSWQKR